VSIDKEFGAFAPAIIKLRIACEKLADAKISNTECVKSIKKARAACQSAQVAIYAPSNN